MNNYKKNSFTVLDIRTSKSKEVTKTSWFIVFINWLRGTKPKREYIWTVCLTIDKPKVINNGDYFMSVTEQPYKCIGKLENTIIAVSLNPLEQFDIVNPCVVVKSYIKK
jgi:hypothetical protein